MGSESQYLDKLFDLISEHVADHHAWDYSSYPPDVYQIRCDNGEIFQNDSDMIKKAIDAKRNGLYDKSIYYYYFLLDAQYKAFRKIPIATLRSCVKTLIAANCFVDAYQYLYAMSANIFKAKHYGIGVDEGLCDYIQQDFMRLIGLSISAIDAGDLSDVEPYCSDVSGSMHYELPCNKEEILRQLKTVRNFVKESLRM